MIEKINGNSMVTANSKQIELLKHNFPQCFDKDGNFIMQEMVEIVSQDDLELSKESYSLNWLGKSYARLLANENAMTMLKEDKNHNLLDENKNSENILIKGDNLEVLKHLKNAYSEAIKMIYIDPPYNTGGDGFVYNDDRKFTPQELAGLAGVTLDEAKRILEFTASKSNSHSAWLTFMYPRLYIARELLKDDGVIFISIDDNEMAQLRLLCDEVFGAENFVGELAVVNNIAGRSDRKNIATAHEYILVYQKSSDFEANGLPLNEEQLREYRHKDAQNKLYRLQGLRKRGSGSKREDRPNMYYPVYFDVISNQISLNQNKFINPVIIVPKLANGNDGRWRWGKETFNDKKSLLEVKKVERRDEFDINERVYLENDDDIKSIKMKSFLLDSDYTSDTATSEYHEIMGLNTFNNPKSTQLIQDLIIISDAAEELVLDFFAGSGTTGDAVMQLNVKDGGNRKFILAQLAEPCSDKTETGRSAIKFLTSINKPTTIFEITAERLRRAAKKIKEEQPDYNGDLGFKIFETTPIFDGLVDNMDELQDDSNLVLFNPEKLNSDDFDALLTTYKVYDGMPLTQQLETIELNSYKAYYGNNRLYLIHNGFKIDNLRALLEKLDKDKQFNPSKVILFGYNFESARQREIKEALISYANKKSLDINLIVRY